ncbi:MAG: phosphatidate cytidylyltransferase [Saprospiraceae bacterium]
MNTLARRSLTALIFGIVVIGSIWASPITFTLLFLLVAFLCLWEFFHLVSPEFSWPEGLGIALGMAPVVWEAAAVFFEITWTPSVLPVLLGFSGFASLLLVLRPQRVVPLLAYWAMGLAYIGLPFYFLMKIAWWDGAFSAALPFGILLLTWANDTGAYLVGSQIGKRKLFPVVSPNKTWEGTLGGILFTILAGWGIYAIGWFGSLQDGLILGAIVGVFGTLGDLVESQFKRSFQVKDSGTLLPGHGGALDRFDSFVFLLPWVAGYVAITTAA